MARLLLLALPIAFARPLASAQSKPAEPGSPKPPAAEAGAASAKPGTPTAMEILAKAIEAQGLPTGRDPAADLPPALRIQVNLQYTSEKGDKISVNAERKFLVRKDGQGLLWTRVVPTSDKSAETIVGFDGTRPWLWSKQAAERGNGLRWLDEPGSETDLQQLEEDLDSTTLITKAFLLRNLPSQLKDLKSLPDETWNDEKTGVAQTVWVIEGLAEVDQDGQKIPTKLQLSIDQKTAFLCRARVTFERKAPLLIRFTKHEQRNGVVVPGKIELYWNDEEKPSQTFYVSEFEIAPTLTPEDFAPPATKK